MVDKAQQRTIETLKQIANNRYFKDSVDDNLQWDAFLDVFLNVMLKFSCKA